MNQLEKHYTWGLVPRSKASIVLTRKWIFRVKDVVFPHGAVFRIPKARIVARGFQQLQGVDHGATYAPVVMFTSIPVVLALVPHLDFELHQMDVVIAFLTGYIDVDVYLGIHEGCSSDFGENEFEND